MGLFATGYVFGLLSIPAGLAAYLWYLWKGM